jgi:hypothetical protein
MAVYSSGLGCAAVEAGETNGKQRLHVLMLAFWCLCSSKIVGTVVMCVPSINTAVTLCTHFL